MDPDKQVQSLYSAVLFCSTAAEVAGDAGAPGAAASRPLVLPRRRGRGAGARGRGARQGLLRAPRPGSPHAGVGGWQDFCSPALLSEASGYNRKQVYVAWRLQDL